MATYTEAEKKARLKHVRASRERMKKQGFEYVNIKVPSSEKETIKEFARELCDAHQKQLTN